MNEPVIVPDASVLLKWSFDSPGEKYQHQALAIRRLWLAGKYRIVLPSLWVYEVGNIIGMKQPDLAHKLLDIYIQYRFEEESATNLYERILDIMKAIDVTFYDAAYHAVALKHRGTYVSADDKYVRKAQSIGNIMALRDWAPE